MKIAVIGSGYVGLVTAACLADFGHFVTAIDKDQEKIAALKAGKIPIYEIGLEEIVHRNMKEKRLSFSGSLGEGIKGAQVIFIGVGTPPLEDGPADLHHVEEVAKEIAQHLTEYAVIVNKSTVPVGTGQRVKEIIIANLRAPVEFDVVSNPEFLREGSAVTDFTHPDRVVIGTESERARKIMEEVYRTLYLIETPFVFTNLESAELIKYASNAFLATKITFINEIADLCEAVGADVQVVAKGMGLDGRIGPKFLHTGPGYGGSCFPKDTRALAQIARDHGERITIVETVIAANENRKKRMVEKIRRMTGPLAGKTLAILGLAFKPNTDDVRESPALAIVKQLLDEGAQLRVHDPAAMAETRKIFGDQLIYCDDPYEAAQGADALVLVTEWNSYRRLDLGRIRSLLQSPVLIDLRNIYTPEEVSKYGFRYDSLGRKSI
jgi:UDPglucose 6-dehydrogenase